VNNGFSGFLEEEVKIYPLTPTSPQFAKSADSDVSYVIASQGEMADAMSFSVRRAQRPLQPIAYKDNAGCLRVG
jgi:hypothetical protein